MNFSRRFFILIETDYRGSIPAFPSKGLRTFEGKAGDDQGIWLESDSNYTACISYIKGQENKRRKKLDYYCGLVSKQAENRRKQRDQNRIDRHRRSFDYVKVSDGDYVVLNQKHREPVRQKELLIIYEGLVLARKIKKDSSGDEFKIKRGGGKKKEITEFSKRSRLNMMKHLGMLKNRPEFWFDLTYPDDVMEGLRL